MLIVKNIINNHFSKSFQLSRMKEQIKIIEEENIQFVNPKSIIVGLTSISIFIDTQNNYFRDSIILTSMWFLMAIGSQVSWCLMGKYMRKFATSDKFIKNFNYTMSFLLIVCVILFYV